MGPRKKERIDAIKLTAFSLSEDALPHLKVCYLCDDWLCSFLLMRLDCNGRCEPSEELVVKERRSKTCKETPKRVLENLVSVSDIDHIVLVTCAEDVTIPDDMC